MNRLIIIIPAIILTCLFGCDKVNIANAGDYEQYLYNDRDNETSIPFWTSRLNGDTSSYINKVALGYQYLKKFHEMGEMDDLLLADSFFMRGTLSLMHKDPEILYALSQTAITKHQFKRAYEIAYQASETGGERYTTSLLKFDAAIELGYYQEANSILNSLVDKKSFDYLIRKSKLEDHHGRQENGIKALELAFDKVKWWNNDAIYCWAGSALADMYGHAGRIKESYDLYLKVLLRNNSYLHALKGIAWIAYSHDRNAGEAKRILHYIYSVKPQPELLLMLADIAAWEKNEGVRVALINQFINEVEQKEYGGMYNTHLVSLYSEERQDFEIALKIASEEVDARPTPMSYDLLAWVYFQKGDVEKAMGIINTYVRGKTEEPVALYHMALIFKSAGYSEISEELFEKALESSFELGPVLTTKIRKQLSSS